MSWNVNIYNENDSTEAELWSRALGTDQKNEITDTSGGNEFPL